MDAILDQFSYKGFDEGYLDVCLTYKKNVNKDRVRLTKLSSDTSTVFITNRLSWKGKCAKKNTFEMYL